ncbi:MAG: DUF3540 domain-containing protein [Desulfovibrio sp.]|nr:DUF3540 domain-containing protein [Desulfovibrio sp.]
MLDVARNNDMLQPALASGRVQQADRGAALVAGPFGLVRARELALRAESGLALQAPSVRVEAGVLVQAVESVKTFASKIFEKASLRFGLFGKHAEHVSGLRETKASRMRVTIDENLRVRSASADLKARESMRIDGGHINIG